MNETIASQNKRRKMHRKVFERIKESKWGTSCKSMCIKQLWNFSWIPYSKLSRVVIYAATWATFKPKLKKQEKSAPKKNFIFQEMALSHFFNSPLFPERSQSGHLCYPQKIFFQNCSLKICIFKFALSKTTFSKFFSLKILTS